VVTGNSARHPNRTAASLVPDARTVFGIVFYKRRSAAALGAASTLRRGSFFRGRRRGTIEQGG
jgi:hypothetical protein